MSLNSSITSYLNRYIECPNPQYAVMLTGDWGSGKTYYINRWIEYVKAIKGKKYSPLYVSLYGVQTLSQLRDNLNRQLHPFLTSAFMKGAKKMASGVAKTMMKVDLGDEAKSAEVSYELDLLQLFQSDNKEIKAGGKILVFDDLERCRINRVELLGFINYFIEHCGCKVILLCNEDKMNVRTDSRLYSKSDVTESKQECWREDAVEEYCKDREYVEFKEKSIGATFEIKTNVDEALSAFVKEIASDPSNVITNLKPFLVSMLNSTQNRNMRIVRQFLFDFDSIVKQIPRSFYQNEAYVPTMRKLLIDMLIVQIEVKAGNKLFDDIDSLVYNFLPGDKNNSYTSLIEHYGAIPERLGIKILDYDSVKKIVKYIKTGMYPIEDIVAVLNKVNEEQKPWDKLIYYWKISNKEFDRNYKLTAVKLKKREIETLEDLIDISFRLVNFEQLHIRSTSKTFSRDVMFCYGKLTKKLKALDDVVIFQQELVSRLRYYANNEKIDKWSNLVDEMQRVLEDLKTKKKSYMTEILENLDSGTLPKLQELLTQQNPIYDRGYSMSPMFEQPNPIKVAKGILKLSNDERFSLREMLFYHYQNLAASNYNIYNFYEPERKNVTEIVDILKRKRLTLIDRYSVNLIIREFEQFLNHKGE